MTSRPRGFALLIVLLALSVAVIVVAGLQAAAFRQAAEGRAEVARVRAHWAARAGLESAIARLGAHLERADATSAYDAIDDMAEVSSGEVLGATWSVVHELEEQVVDGPSDPHAKLNINTLSRDSLLALDFMTEDMADSILDWIDEDDDPRELGAEVGYYTSLPSPYEPRNLPMRTLEELELVAGVTPELVRGEDWNLNGRLDPNEDDGDLSWPPDNADGALDAGWSALVTVSSVEPSRAASGETKLNLTTAASTDLLARVPTIDPLQAETLLAHAQTENARIEDLISTSLTQIAQQTGQANAQAVRPLDDEQIRLLLDECTYAALDGAPMPGRVNINTVSRDALDRLVEVPSALADSLILARDGKATGYVHLMDLLEIPGVNRQRLVDLSRFISVSSGAYTVSCVGRDEATGIEAEITATLGASTLPIPITEQRVR